MKRAPFNPQFSFRSRLERIAEGINYFAISVPLKVSQALQTRGPVPIHAQVNDSPLFLVSMFPVGEGRHYIRVKAEIRKAANLKEGDALRVQFSVRNRADEVSLPKDLAKALRTQGLTDAFHAQSIGKRSYTLRKIDEAAKPETRAKRILAAVNEAKPKK